MENPQAAQAVRLIDALCAQLDDMTAQLARLERMGAAATRTTATKTGVASATRSEAALLRRDIGEAQVHIDRLQRRYLGGTAGGASLAPRAAQRIDPRLHGTLEARHPAGYYRVNTTGKDH